MNFQIFKSKYVKSLIINLLLVFNVSAQTLSPQATVSLLTVDAGNEELYTVFGHSVMRVQDPIQGIDWVYNYGVFDFRTPNFYLKFVRGQLPYQLLAYDFYLQFDEWKTDNRLVTEQKLNLTQRQKQTIFDFLQKNFLPENREYFYKFFYDNCSTRIRDVVANSLKDSLQLSTTLHADSSYRQWIDKYSAKRKPWGAFGMDIGLGLPSDEKTGAMGAMFLPKNMADAFEAAKVLRDGKWQPLVLEKHPVNIEYLKPELKPSNIFTPNSVFWTLAIAVILLTFWQFKKGVKGFLFDTILFSIVGLAGWFLVILWFFTDHVVTSQNLNIIWTFPFLFPVALMLKKVNSKAWLKSFFLIYALVVLVFALAGVLLKLLPQGVNMAVLPINILLIIRVLFVVYRLKK